MAQERSSLIEVEDLNDSRELQVLWETDPHDDTTDFNNGRRDLIDLRTPDLIDLATPEVGQIPLSGTPGIPDTPPNSPRLNSTQEFEVDESPRTSTPIGTPPDFGVLQEEIPEERRPSGAPIGAFADSLGHNPGAHSSRHSSADLQDITMNSTESSGDVGSVYDYPHESSLPGDNGSYFTISTREAFFGAPSLDYALLKGPHALHAAPEWQPDGEEFPPDVRSFNWMFALAAGLGYARLMADPDQEKAIAFSMLGLQRQLRLGFPNGQLVIEPALITYLPRDEPLRFQGPEVAPRGTAACPNCRLWFQFDAHGGPTMAIWLAAQHRRDPTFCPPPVLSKERYGLHCLNPGCQSPHLCLKDFHPILDDGYFGSEFLDEEYDNSFRAQFDFEVLGRILLQKPILPPTPWIPELPEVPTPFNTLSEMWRRVTSFLEPDLAPNAPYDAMTRFDLVPNELRWEPTSSGRCVLTKAALRSLPQMPLINEPAICEYGCPNCLWTWGVAHNNQRTHVYRWYPVCPLPDCFRPEQHSDMAIFVTHLCPNPACTRPNYPVLLEGPGGESSLDLPRTCRQYAKAAYFDLCNHPGRLMNSADRRGHVHPYSRNNGVA